MKTYDMHARHYRPELGRFLSRDTYASAAGEHALQADPLTQNRYAFAGGNPVDNIEWDGHGPCGNRLCPESRDDALNQEARRQLTTRRHAESNDRIPGRQRTYGEQAAALDEQDLRIRVVDALNLQANQRTRGLRGLREHPGRAAAGDALLRARDTVQRSDPSYMIAQNLLTAFGGMLQSRGTRDARDATVALDAILKNLPESGPGAAQASAFGNLLRGQQSTEAAALAEGKLLGRLASGVSAAGAAMTFISSVSSGDDAWRAGFKAAFTTGGAYVGALAGPFCGPAAAACGFAGAVGVGFMANALADPVYDLGGRTVKRMTSFYTER